MSRRPKATPPLGKKTSRQPDTKRPQHATSQRSKKPHAKTAEQRNKTSPPRNQKVAATSSKNQLPTLQVGRQSAGFIRRGHPWVRRDRFLGSLAGLQTGDCITLVDENGQRLASALADPEADDNIIARVYDNRPDRVFDVAAAVRRAAEARARLLRDPDTDCFRLIHGEGDFMPGVRVECYGDCAVLLLRCAAAAAHTQAIVAALQDTLGHSNIIIREQISDLRRAPAQARHATGRPLDPERHLIGREFGQRYHITPENDLATGIYVDQRGTRAWLGQHIANWPEPPTVLNLFAYTGIFSTFALSAGAATATDMDVAAPALDIAQKNAALNGFAEQHQIIRGDCLQQLTNIPPASIDIVVCDPPTAATALDGSKGWVTRRDYPLLLAAIRPVLKPNGLLIACCNTLGKTGKTAKKAFDLEQATADFGQGVAAPDLALDIPQRRGFPEGRPFQIVVRRV